MKRRQTTAVEIRCPKGHLIASVHPFPALGTATHLDVTTQAARYRPGMAEYLRGATAERGWATVPATSSRYTIADFDRSAWARSTTWACRCGLHDVDPRDVIEQAWAWSYDRKRQHGNPPTPRVITL